MPSKVSRPLLIALPWGLGVSGVTTWAVRLVNALAAGGRVCGLVVHPEPAGSAVVAAGIDSRVRVTRLRGVPAIDATGGDLGPFLPAYRAAVDELLAAGGAPVVVSPNLHGDCYGIAAALTAERPEAVRMVGWQHSDIAYDTRVLVHYEPVLAGIVAVSERTEERLRTALPADRAGAVRVIPYGVEVPAACPARRALRNGRRRPRPVRLIYTGRLEHAQKRVLALPALSRELARRGVAHTLTIAGDGPAAAELDEALHGCRCARRVGPVAPEAIAILLDESDALVLPSRYEGLSVAMLEAMARGCVPIVTRVDSGLLEALRDGENGRIAAAGPEASEEDAGRALADAVERFVAGDAPAISRSAWETARERFSIERHVATVNDLLAEAAAAPTRTWPAPRWFAFTAAGADGSGSVPADGADRMQRMLSRLAGRRVAIHGTGEHTRQLRGVILASPATLVAFTDDDPAARGKTMWGLPVVAPAECAAAGATDVVISSWMHQDAVWARRDAYAGLTVHRLYAA